MQIRARNIDEYVKGFSSEIRKKLEEMRSTISKAAPGAEETIKYAIPTFTLQGKNLVHFAAFKNHIGFYPAPHGIEAFKTELSKYESSKGAVRFPLDKPLPLTLITKIVKFRVRKEAKIAKASKAK